jgi:hypothetical protein
MGKFRTHFDCSINISMRSFRQLLFGITLPATRRKQRMTIAIEASFASREIDDAKMARDSDCHQRNDDALASGLLFDLALALARMAAREDDEVERGEVDDVLEVH